MALLGSLATLLPLPAGRNQEPPAGRGSGPPCSQAHPSLQFSRGPRTQDTCASCQAINAKIENMQIKNILLNFKWGECIKLTSFDLLLSDSVYGYRPSPSRSSSCAARSCTGSSQTPPRSQLQLLLMVTVQPAQGQQFVKYVIRRLGWGVVHPFPGAPLGRFTWTAGVV